MASGTPLHFRIENCSIDDWDNYPESILTVYYLQEVYAAPQVRKDLVWILKGLLQTTGCRLVCMTAASGQVAPAKLREDLTQLGTREERIKTVMQLLEGSQLSAEQTLWVLDEVEFDIFGIENVELYWRAIISGERSYELWDLWRRVIGSGQEPQENSLRGDLLRRGTNSASLAAFLRDYHAGQLEVLLSYAEQLGLELNPVIRPFQAMKALETQIDFSQANEEILGIIGELNRVLGDSEYALNNSLEKIAPHYELASPQSLQQALSIPGQADWPLVSDQESTLLNKLVEYAYRNQSALQRPLSVEAVLDLYMTAFANLKDEVKRKFEEYRIASPNIRAGTVEAHPPPSPSMKSLGAIFQYWAELMLLLDIPSETCPNVIKYIWYCNRAGRVDLKQAVAAIDSLKEVVRNRLCIDSHDRAFLHLVDLLEHLSRVLGFEAMGSSVKELANEQRKKELQHAELCASLQQFIPESPALQEFASLGAEYRECYEGCMTWYRLQSDRANTFFENTVRCMIDEGKPEAILMTGGFQREEVVAMFRQRRVSYVVLVPMIRQEVSEAEMKEYIKALLNQTRMKKAARDNAQE